MTKEYKLFLRVMKALRWHGLLLSPKEAAYVRPLSKQFNINLEPAFRLKAMASWPTLDYCKKPYGYWLKTGVCVKNWALNNYKSYSPFSYEKTIQIVKQIEAISEDGSFILERLSN